MPPAEGNSRKAKRKCKFEMPQFLIEDEGACEHYDSRFIEYPLTIEGLEILLDKKHDSAYNEHKEG